MDIYYVYQYLREDLTPYYIGKGSNGRAYSNCRAIPKPRDKNRIQIIANGLAEADALLLETNLIQHYGRIDLGTGILRNMTDGGDGVMGKVWSKQSKLAVSKAKTEWHKQNDTSGRNNPMYGQKHSQEVRDASRERALRTGFVGNRRGSESPHKGKTYIEVYGLEKALEKQRKMSEARLKTPKVKCQYCDKIVAPHILSRFHGINCPRIHDLIGQPVCD